ncbi:MAG: sensor histidine kinase [Bryobacterales bacterium]|nr:sensor histidine kinase [Bryobacterales bacterium]
METTPDLTLPDLALPDLTTQCLIHDLNNIFQILMEAADLLSDDPRWESLSATIFRSIERGRDITLSMQAANHGSAPLETVLDKAVTFVQDSVAMHHGPKIGFACDIEPGIVLHHPWGWERVLLNLFLNSVHAMPRGGTISVRARRTDREFEMVVADDGLGIAPDLLPRIFQPNSSTRIGGGLGLHIVNSIVKSEDGTVSAANRETGGAEFTITIPTDSAISRASA